MFEPKLRNNYWGQFGIPSYEDESISEENKLLVLRQLGYVDNEWVKFNSWVEYLTNKRITGIYPCSILFDYRPTLIPWLVNSSLLVELYTEEKGCEINIYGIRQKLLQFPKEKREETWKEFYLSQIIPAFRAVEEELMMAWEAEWFFPTDSFDKFVNVAPGWQTLQGEPVSFKRIQFGSRGSYWGTYWFKIPK